MESHHRVSQHVLWQSLFCLKGFVVAVIDGSLLCIVQLLDSLRQLKDNISEPGM